MSETHWRSIVGTKYLAGDEVLKEITVMIEKWEEVMVYSKKDKKDIPMLALYFKGTKKAMLVTPRKGVDIGRELGSPHVENWVGKQITIYAKDEKHFGKTFPVITIKKDPKNYV